MPEAGNTNSQLVLRHGRPSISDSFIVTWNSGHPDCLRRVRIATCMPIEPLLRILATTRRFLASIRRSRSYIPRRLFQKLSERSHRRDERGHAHAPVAALRPNNGNFNQVEIVAISVPTTETTPLPTLAPSSGVAGNVGILCVF